MKAWKVQCIGDCPCGCREVLLFTDVAGTFAAANYDPMCLGCTVLRGSWWTHLAKADCGKLPTISELATAWQVQRALKIYVVPTIDDVAVMARPLGSNTGHRLRATGKVRK